MLREFADRSQDRSRGRDKNRFSTMPSIRSSPEKNREIMFGRCEPRAVFRSKHMD